MLACSRREKTGFTLRIHFETVQFGDGLRQNFSLILLADALEVLGDLFARVRPNSCAVGKLRRPEQIVDTDLVPMSQSIRTIDKRGKQLGAKIFAVLARQLALRCGPLEHPSQVAE